MATKELWEAFSYPTVCSSVPLRVWCISPIFFEVGISNLVCGCILGWQSVAFHLPVTVTLNLTSDIVFRIFVSNICVRRVSLILFEIGIPNFVCACILG